jgi:hypothetical protein
VSEDDSAKQNSYGQQNIPPAFSGSTENKTGEEVEASRNPSGVTGDQAGNPPEPPWFHRFMHSHFPDATPHDHWTLLFTAVIAFSTILYTGASVWTLVEIRAGGVDTHNLALAAAIQASHTEEIAQAANNQVDAANEISDAADSFSETAETAVEEFKKAAAESAAASDKVARNAERTIKQTQESFRDDQRAWVGSTQQSVAVFDEKKGIAIQALFINSGRSPARKVKLQVMLSPVSLDGPSPESIQSLKKAPWNSCPTIPPQGQYTITVGNEPSAGQVVTAENRRTIQMVIDRFGFIKTKTLFLYDIGEIAYEDTSGRQHLSTFCFYLADPEARVVAYCPEFNEIE